MKKGIVFLFLVFDLQVADGQITFEKLFHPSQQQYGRKLFNRAGNGYFLQGTIVQNWINCYLIRTDSFGDTLWTKTYGTDSIQFFAFDMAETDDGGYVMCGDYQTVLTYPSMDSYLQKIDSNGNQVWFNRFGWSSSDGGSKDYGELIKTLADGSIVVEGSTKDYYLSLGNYQPSGSGWRSYLARFDAQGVLTNIATVKLKIGTFSDPDYAAFDIETIGNKIYWLGLGYFAAYPHPYNTRLVAFDENLDTIFTVNNGLNSVFQLSKTSDDHLLLFGDGEIIKMDTLGNTVWATPNNSPSLTYDLIELPSGDLVSIGGQVYISPWTEQFYNYGSQNIYLDRHTSTGSLTSIIPFFAPSGSFSEVGYSLVSTSDDGFAFVGFRDTDIWLVKTDSSGSLIVPNINSLAFGINILPNPTPSNSSLTFTYPSTSAKNEIILYSIHGKEIARYALPQWSSTQTVKLPQMAGGVYVARMVGENESAMVKFVVE
jgi:hypothetical protein